MAMKKCATITLSPMLINKNINTYAVDTLTKLVMIVTGIINMIRKKIA
jgi:hypothetical protein